MIPEIYKKLMDEHKFAPIIGPRIELVEFEEDKDLKLNITIVEKPDIKINDYKKAIKDLGKLKAKEKEEDKKEITNVDIVEKLLEISEIEIPEIIVQEEVSRMMSSLIDQTSKMGISIEEYAEAHKKNLQQIRDEYKENAEKTIKSDFLITEVAKEEGIDVTEEDIEKTINVIPDEESRKQFENPEQRMYIKAVMLKAKTLENLVQMAKGDSAQKI